MVAGTVYRAQWEFAHDSGLPKDRVAMTTHWATTQVVGIDYDNLRDMLIDFWEDPGAGAGLYTYLSPVLTGAWTLDIYHLTDPSPRVPVKQYTGSLLISPSGEAMPSEVALCTTWLAAPVSGVPAARLRGRNFIGPLDTSALAAAGGVPDPNFLADVVRASDALASAADASVTWDFVIYSTVIAGTSGSGDRANKVVSGFVDNAFDTQRRRGEEATGRTTWAI